MLDTGATLSAMSSGVAEELGLYTEHFVPVYTLGGYATLPMHVVRIVLDTETQPLRPRGVLEAPMEGFDGQPVIIGRDILQYGTLRMSPGSFDLRNTSLGTFNWRTSPVRSLR